MNVPTIADVELSSSFVSISTFFVLLALLIAIENLTFSRRDYTRWRVLLKFWSCR